MLKKSVVLFLAALSPLLADTPINPQPPVFIIDAPIVESAVAVSGNSSVFVAASQGDGNNAVINTSSDLGASWPLADEPGTDVLGPVSVCGYGSTFVAGWAQNDIGGYFGIATVSTSTDGQGQTWGPPIDIAPAQDGNVQNFVKVCAAESGFMAVWIYYNLGMINYFQLWSSFSADGMTWSSPVLVSIPTVDAGFIVGAVAGNSSGYVATWQYDDGSGLSGYANFSNNNGSSWSAPVEVAPSIFNNTNLSISATEAGFMTVWVDNDNNANWSFSSDGMSWSAPAIFATNLISYVDINVAGTESGFVAAWQDNTNNAWASFTGDLGQTWSTPVLLSAGTMFNGNVNAESNIGVSAVGANCMFTWWDVNNDAVSCYSPLNYTPPPPTPSSSSTPSSPFFKQVTPNNPGMGLW